MSGLKVWMIDKTVMAKEVDLSSNQPIEQHVYTRHFEPWTINHQPSIQSEMKRWRSWRESLGVPHVKSQVYELPSRTPTRSLLFTIRIRVCVGTCTFVQRLRYWRAALFLNEHWVESKSINQELTSINQELMLSTMYKFLIVESPLLLLLHRRPTDCSLHELLCWPFILERPARDFSGPVRIPHSKMRLLQYVRSTTRNCFFTRRPCHQRP